MKLSSQQLLNLLQQQQQLTSQLALINAALANYNGYSLSVANATLTVMAPPPMPTPTQSQITPPTGK